MYSARVMFCFSASSEKRAYSVSVTRMVILLVLGSSFFGLLI